MSVTVSVRCVVNVGYVPSEDEQKDNLRKALTFMGSSEFLQVGCVRQLKEHQGKVSQHSL